MEMFEAFENAVVSVGSQSAFARGVGTSQQRVSYLLKHKRVIPAELVLPTEELTGVSRHLLRPDIYPHDAPAPSQPHCGVVSSAAPIVACDRSGILHRGDQ